MIAAFQSKVYSHLAGAIKDEGRNPDETNCEEELYNHIFHLFPVSSVKTPTRTLCYQKYWFPTDDAPKRIYVGHKWDKSELNSPSPNGAPSIEAIEEDLIKVFPERTSSGGLEAIMERHRVRHSMQQQKDYASRLHQGLRKAQIAADKDQNLAYAVVARWATRTGTREPRMDDLYETICDDQAPKGREPYVARHHPLSLKRYVAEAFKVQPSGTDAELISYLRKIMQRSVLLQISEYFETGPTRLVTHSKAREYFNGTLNDLKESTETYFDPLEADISAIIASSQALTHAAGERLADFENFHAEVVQKVHKAKTLECRDDALTNWQRQKLRIPPTGQQVSIFGKFLDSARSAFRCYVINPILVLEPFFRCISDNAVLFNKLGYYTRRLRYDLPSPKFAPNNVSGFPAVKLVEHLIIFGFMSDLPPLEEFKGSEICKLWEASECPLVSSLYVHSAASTSLFLKGRFIKDEVAHKTFKRDGLVDLITSSNSCFVISLETWRTVESESTRRNWMDEPEKETSPMAAYCVSFNISSEGKEGFSL